MSFGKFAAGSGSALVTCPLTLPGNDSVSLANGAGPSMTPNDFTSRPGPGQSALDALARRAVKVAVELGVGASQTSGNYSGNFAVYVARD